MNRALSYALTATAAASLTYGLTAGDDVLRLKALGDVARVLTDTTTTTQQILALPDSTIAGWIKSGTTADGRPVKLALYDPAQVEIQHLPTHRMLVTWRQDQQLRQDVWLSYNPLYWYPTRGEGMVSTFELSSTEGWQPYHITETVGDCSDSCSVLVNQSLAVEVER